jgi:hypothetical protein
MRCGGVVFEGGVVVIYGTGMKIILVKHQC